MDCHPAFTSVEQEEDGWPLAQGPGCLPISNTWQHKVLANTKAAPCKVISKTKPNPRYKCVIRKCFPSWGSVLDVVGLEAVGT